MSESVDDDAETPRWYRKHYTCVCQHEWWDEWDCLCNDRCPVCNKEIECDDWEDITLPEGASLSLRC